MVSVMPAERPARARCRSFGLALLAALLALAPRAAGARDLSSLGSLERQASEDALRDRGLRLDPAPAGKRIGQIHVVNHEVFSERDSYLQLLNMFHWTTREHVIRREVLLQPGDSYVEELVEESTRNLLRDALLSSLVVVLPVLSTQPGAVDLLVVTRDLWSLRFNTEFDYGEGTLRALDTSLSENNLFGRRKKFSFAYSLRRDTHSLGPSYVDPNLIGSRLVLSGGARLIFNRTSREREGASISGGLRYPLFSLASRWGASISGSYASAVYRQYLGNQVARINVGPSAAEPIVVPYSYAYRRGSVESQVVRSFPGRVINRVAVGHTLGVLRPRLERDFPTDDPAAIARFRQYLPRSERVSRVYASYSLFTPRYRVYRDFATYDLREDRILGPSLSASLSRAAGWLGSDRTYFGFSASASYAGDLGDGYQSISLSWSGLVREGRREDEDRGVGVYLASPMLRRLVRLVGSMGLSAKSGTTQPRVDYYTVGSESLRAYATGEFQGQVSWVGHLEARSAPLPVASFRLGVVTFYDVGHAAERIAELRAKQDVGLGLRLLIPQLNYEVLRVDWAVALVNGRRLETGARLTRAGLPGRISATFSQAF